MNNIVIIDYGMGNLRSIYVACKRIAIPIIISSDLNEIKLADKIILPGVGHFGTAIENLKNRKMKDLIERKIRNDKVPILGICLGMQLITKYSEEGNAEGFGWISASTVKFTQKEKMYKIPHIGWNSISITNSNPLLVNISGNELFYFVHSYYVNCENSENIIATTDYGVKFASIISAGNIFGTQFHPEKSHDAGLVILKNFYNI